MKKTLLIVFTIALFSLFLVPITQAQMPATQIETLILDIWPDYDEPSVLILMTGTLPPDTPLPATVTIPLVADAQINAVARITSDNQMMDDVVFTTENNSLTLTTPDPRFRVEYYAPYESDGSTHAFSFDWLADIPVEGVLAAVQQPTSALNMNVTPESANIVTDSTDGFTYYTFPPDAIPAGEQFTIAFDYQMTTPQLSVDNLPVNSSMPPSTTSNTAPETAVTDSFSLDDIDWVLVLGLIGVVLFAVVVTWQVATRQSQPARASRKPRPNRTTAATKSSSQTRFCHECGHQINVNDRFCPKCGTAVKSTK